MRKALYSIPELARMAGVAPNTIRRLIERRGIKTVAVGSGTQRQKRLVPLSEILEKLPALFKSHKCVEHLGIPPLNTKSQ